MSLCEAELSLARQMSEFHLATVILTACTGGDSSSQLGGVFYVLLNKSSCDGVGGVSPSVLVKRME